MTRPSAQLEKEESMLSRLPKESFLLALTEPSSIIFLSRADSLSTKPVSAAAFVITYDGTAAEARQRR